MREILFSICAAAIMTAVYKALVPSDRFSAQIKLLISCFFVVTVINAVSGLGGIFDISSVIAPDPAYNDYSVQVRQLTADETANNLRAAITSELAKENISPEKIYIDVNISDNGSISINEIKLVFGSAAYELDSGRAVSVVRRMTGTKIKVTAEISSISAQAKREREDQ